MRVVENQGQVEYVLETGEVTYEEPMAADQAQEQASEAGRTSKFGAMWKQFCAKAKEIVRAGMHIDFVAERNGECMFTLPVLFVVVGMLFWGATLWMLIFGLFFGLRYHIEGVNPVTVDVNRAMDKAADLAEDIKQNSA